MFAKTPEPPYYLLAFSSQRTFDDDYNEVASKMVELAFQQKGCLGAESVRDGNGFGITNSFWQDEASIKAWKANIDHQIVQKLGRTHFYSSYIVRVARGERDYCFSA